MVERISGYAVRVVSTGAGVRGDLQPVGGVYFAAKVHEITSEKETIP